MTDISRKFLAVSDETEECVKALVFAGLRAKAVGSGLVILRCAESPGLGGWIGLDKDISQDAMDSARLKATRHADAVESRAGVKAELVVSEDDPVDAIRKLVDQDMSIKVLVLAAGMGRSPGPLVSRLAKGKPIAARPIAVTVIPGDLTDAQLNEIGGLAG
ncbi:MAG: universal stress protein [Hyphomonadaceae bacterium]|nr:universal stress protein [Hyphomonadaceae bacterium]MBP9233904.1 universal stress protein [Hyphomonadaceae bacterium]